MNIFQKTIYRLCRAILNPYFEKHPGAAIFIMFSFQDAVKKAGFTDEELKAIRKVYDKRHAQTPE